MAEMILEQFSISRSGDLNFEEFLFALTLPNKYLHMIDGKNKLVF